MTTSRMTPSNPPFTPSQRSPLSVRLVNLLLGIDPLFNWIKGKARKRMIDRAEDMGVPWRQSSLEWKERIGPQALGTGETLNADWQQRWSELIDADLIYPDYYQSPFHAYNTGNLSWHAATEVEVAGYAVHATIWPEAGVNGDAKLRQSYQDVLMAQLPNPPKAIVDLGCSTGMSTFALQDCYPEASIAGVELSPYFLSIADRRSRDENRTIEWKHALAESTGLPDNSYDLVSICLVCHELPRTAAREIFAEARRLLRPNGHLAIMDMDPQSDVHRKMPPYVFTLLKSTEPFLDDYFSFDIAEAIAEAGFDTPSETQNSPRHRTLVAKAR